MSAITVGDDLIHYEVLGRGRQVVLVHGWVGSWRYWIPTMQQLQSSYRVYALDLYGFGDSSKNPMRYNLEQQVELLSDFLNDLGLPKVALIGHGLGALIGAEYARRYSDRVARMMAISAPLFDPGNLENRVPAGRQVHLTANRDQTAQPNTTDDGDLVSNAATQMSASVQMRKALIEAAKARAAGRQEEDRSVNDMSTIDREEIIGSNHNPLYEHMNGVSPTDLLGRCFKRTEVEYEKLMVDVQKTDNQVINLMSNLFDAGRMLDTMRLLPMPTAILHGTDDNLIQMPNEAVWNYITVDKDNLVPLVLPGVRHFPMLEYNRFFHLVNNFLDAPDITKLELKERWTRRTR